MSAGHDRARRRFLVAAGAAAFAPRLPAFAACAPATTPATGQALRTLPELPLARGSDGRVTGTLRAAPATLGVGGQPARLLAYGGSFPGNLVRLRGGDTLALRFENRLDRPSNLHFHGLAVSPSGKADNIWVVTPPGADFDHELPLLADEAGLFWIHPHAHGQTARPLFAGLAAPLLVEGAIDRDSELVQADERVVVLKDLSLDNCAPAAHRPQDWIFGKEGEWLLVNGQLRPRLDAQRSLLRLRLLNASNARYWTLALDNGEPLHLIALDGRYLEKRIEVEELLLVPGARAEVLIDLSSGGARQLLYRPSPRRGHGLTPAQPILDITPPELQAPVSLPDALVPGRRFVAAEADAVREIRLSAMLINGKPFKHHHQGMHVAPEIIARAGSREIWTVINDDVMDHPFHLHTWHFEILSVNAKPPPFRQVRDMINLKPGDVARLGIEFDRYTGRTMFHCHIAEHADMGMMAVLEVRDPKG
jgi:FtsP/CotA-like multicopper oxidase with cupredoxin domain